MSFCLYVIESHIENLYIQYRVLPKSIMLHLIFMHFGFAHLADVISNYLCWILN